MPIAHIYNGELGFDVRTKLNALIDQVAGLPAGGTGDVVGPASAIADAVAVYNGTTGKLIKDGGQTIANIIAAAIAGSGTGDVVGPASAINSQIAVFNGITGKLIQDGGMTIADVIAAGGGGGGMAIGGAITSATAGSVLFAGAAGVLSQDNTNFFYDAANFRFKVGHAGATTSGLYINNLPAMYEVPNVSGNNWFDANAGNFGVSGSANFGTGDGALASLTTGSRNVAQGPNALASCLGGSGNLAIGSSVMQNLTTGSGNTAMGGDSGTGYGVTASHLLTGNNNLAVGASALASLTAGVDNVAIGAQALERALSGNSNLAIGAAAFACYNQAAVVGGDSGNVAIGPNALRNVGSGSGNVGIGNNVGVNLATMYDSVIVSGANGVYNTSTINGSVMIGANVAQALTGNSHINTFIGFQAGAYFSQSFYSTLIGGWRGDSGVFSIATIALSDGNGPWCQLNWKYTTDQTWSMMNSTDPQALHIYNTANLVAATNYERAVFDWRKASNVLTIGTEAGGTGVVRPIRWAGLSSKATPIGADSLLLLDSASSGDMKTVLISTLPGGGGGMAIGGAITGGTAGRVLFAGVGGILDDDSTFTWNDSLKDLAIGGAYYVNAARALYVVPHVTENNWFEGNAGNQTVSGYGNFGTGDLSLSSVTTGYDNVALGTNALKLLTSGQQNFALGSGALQSTVTDLNNTAIGTGAMNQLGKVGAGGGGNVQNVAIGFHALAQVEQAYANIAIGSNAVANIGASTLTYNNTVVGDSAGNLLGSGGAATISDNTFIGANAGKNLSGASRRNTFVGGWAGPSAVVNDALAISSGEGRALFDLGVTKAWTFSLSFKGYSLPTGLNIYNTQDALGSAINYERGIFDWVDVPNVFRIGVEAGGTGVVRPIRWTGLSSKATPIGADSLLLLDSASSGDMKTVLISTLPGGGGGGMAIGGAITGATAGRVLFAGVGGILDDDSTFTWNDSLKDLHIGGAYYVSTARALYVVPHVTENNWFEGNAGNQTLSGYGNFGTGDLALSNLTTGYANVAMGSGAGKAMTSGYQNFALGSDAMLQSQTDNNNVVIGRAAMQQMGNAGAGGGNNAGNVAIGFGAMNQVEQGLGNVVIGYQPLSNCFPPTVVNRNVIIGSSAGNFLGYGGGASVFQNTLIGPNAGRMLVGASSKNTWIGAFEGSGTVENTIAISDGGGNYGLFDFHLNTPFAWSIANHPGIGIPPGLHIYNTQTAAGVASNYERAVLDWCSATYSAAGHFIIGTQSSGSGVARNLKFIINNITKLDYGITNAGWWTSTANFTLSSSSYAYYVGTARALYVVPNAAEDNWFEGNAGNQTVTGPGNFGTGDFALAAVTSGYDNVAIGNSAMLNATTGNQNVAMGSYSLNRLIDGVNNVAIGRYALFQAGIASAYCSDNIAMGYGVLNQVNVAGGNVVFGSSAGANIGAGTTADQNLFLGHQSASSMGVSGGAYVGYNTFIGPGAGKNITGGSHNTWIGRYAGPAAVVSGTIALSDGNNLFLLDCNFTTAYAWSFNMASNTVQASVHIYNMQSPAFSASNYERVELDWQRTANVFRLTSQAGGTGVIRLIAIDGFAKAGAPAAADLPASSFAVIDDTSAGQTWLVFNKAGTIRKVQLT